MVLKNLEIEIYKTIDFPVVLYRYETSENRYTLIGQIKYQITGENCITKTFLILITPDIIKVGG
jgi:hypothetical protein